MFEPIIIRVLKSPKTVVSFTLDQWDLLIRQSRAANLLSHLHVVLMDAGLEGGIPEQPANHLKASYQVAQRNRLAVRWEMTQLLEALYPVAVPVVALKGAAYALAGLPISRGRMFHDIDILVPRTALEEVEKRLMAWGWRTTHGSGYDQRYYRTWMHEIPPMKHIRRKTVLDIHHTILPLTARLHPDPGKLLERATNSGGEGDMYWLCDVDMLLHSATHLFHDGELENGLRDLVDIDSLIRGFSLRPGFWGDLCDRAMEMDLVRPLVYALRYAESLLGTEVPDSAKAMLASSLPGRSRLFAMDFLFRRALQPDHSSCEMSGSGLARWVLYVRSHYLRMPLRLLLPHLLRKAVMGEDAGELPREVQRFVANNPKN
jgi:hypothetical protein